MATREQRNQTLRSAEEKTLEVYGSIETARFITSLNKKLRLTDGGPLVDIVGDTILGLLSKDELPQLLMEELNISEEAAKGTSEEVDTFIKAQVNGTTTARTKEALIPRGEQERYERLRLRPEDLRKGGLSWSEPAVKPLTKDDLMDSLSPKRTMQSDINNIKEKDPEKKEEEEQPPVFNTRKTENAKKST